MNYKLLKYNIDNIKYFNNLKVQKNTGINKK